MKNSIFQLEETEGEVDVRETMRSLPSWLQWFLTWLTGKPLQRQQPMYRSTPILELFLTYSWLCGNLCLSAYMVQSGNWYWYNALPIYWLSLVGASRKLQVTICHYCVHYQVTGIEWLDRAIMECTSALLFIQNFDNYFEDHVKGHHNPKIMASAADSDYLFLLYLGFLPGMSVEALWSNLWRTIFSGNFHLTFLTARWNNNFSGVPIWRCLLSIVATMIPIIFFYWIGGIWMYVFLWVFPMTFLYHVSALFQFLSEHLWGRRNTGASLRMEVAQLSIGRFCGEVYPSFDANNWLNSITNRVRWFGRMMFYHFPVRLAVLVGDLPAHDFHHHRPHKNADWANAFYARQREVETGCKGRPEPYRDIWGIHHAIQLVFENISQLPPLEKGVEIDLEEMKASMLGM